MVAHELANKQAEMLIYSYKNRIDLNILTDG